MKNIFVLTTIVSTLTIICACDKSSPLIAASASPMPAVALPTTAELKISNWGPKSTKIGQVPNKQVDGSMGVWIAVTNNKDFGEAQVVFGGQPARLTSVQENAINAAVDGELLKQAGTKEVVIKQLSTGKLFAVGQFKIEQ